VPAACAALSGARTASSCSGWRRRPSAGPLPFPCCTSHRPQLREVIEFRDRRARSWGSGSSSPPGGKHRQGPGGPAPRKGEPQPPPERDLSTPSRSSDSTALSAAPPDEEKPGQGADLQLPGRVRPVTPTPAAELWNLYTPAFHPGAHPGFPISNWTELDVCNTSPRRLETASIYFAHRREVVVLTGGASFRDSLTPVPGRVAAVWMKVRFRTVGTSAHRPVPRRRHPGGHRQGDRHQPRSPSGGTRWTTRPAKLHGAAQEGGLLLMARTPRGQRAAAVHHCGSVDDGKSTLIGRLLYDSKAIWRMPERPGGLQPQARPGRGDLSLLTMACWRSANRASPSTWPTATSPPAPASTSWRRRATSSTPATW